MSNLKLETEIKSLVNFKEILQNNPGVIVIKFGAEWCGPCKKIETQVNQWFAHLLNSLPNKVQPYLIDVDESFELYAFLKSKKMLNGIPAILAYHKGNANYVPDSVIIGANPPDINTFFENIAKHASTS